MQHRTAHLQMGESPAHPLHSGKSQYLTLIITDHRPAITESDLDRVKAETKGANPQKRDIDIIETGEEYFHASSLLELALWQRE